MHIHKSYEAHQLFTFIIHGTINIQLLNARPRDGISHRRKPGSSRLRYRMYDASAPIRRIKKLRIEGGSPITLHLTKCLGIVRSLTVPEVIAHTD
jgi:hypothetical protein